MEWTRSNARTTWTTKNCRQPGAPAIATLRGVVRKQVETGGNEIDKLKLSDRSHSHQRRATSCANDRAFGNGCVDNSFFTKLVEQPVSNFERAAISANIL